MVELTKWEKNVVKAEALESVGRTVSYYITDKKEDIERYHQEITARKIQLEAEDSEPDDDWQIINWEKSIISYEAQIALWEKLEKTLEKEMNA